MLNLLISGLDIVSLALLFVVIRFYAPRSEALPHFLLPGFSLPPHSLWPGVLLLLFFAGKSWGGYAVYKMQYRFAHGVSSRLSETGLLQYMEGRYTDHVNNDAAVFVRKIVYVPTEFAQFILLGTQQLLTEAALVLLSVAALLLYSPRLLAIVSLTLLPAIVLLSYITRKRLAGIRKNIKTVNEQALQYLHESLAGFVESNLYNKNDFFIGRYAAAQRTVGSYIANMQITQGIPSRFFELFAVLGLFILIVALNIGAAGSTTDIITLGAFIAAAYKIIPGISRIINLAAQVHTYEYTVKELAAQAAHTNPPSLPAVAGKLETVELSNLHFAYNGSPLFSGFNLALQRGAFTGISGYSGRGKTTLLNLLLGFLTPQSGEVLLNGKKVTAAERKAWWNNIAYVKQEPFLVHDSVLNNIVLFDRQYNREKLNQVLEITALKEIIDRFPEGLEKLVTENGRNISGGQRQRIAIARALYKDADLILLDEPFNELDEASETRLLQHFKQLADSGKMVIFITHSSKSLDYCNSIVHLNEA